jgi:hypothetical protein
MAESSTRPSNKGYKPVPVVEGIDDDVDSPGNAAEGEDNDDLYDNSAPLLSNRSRGNEPPHIHAKECWYHRLTSLNPFGRREPSWQTPPKRRNWRRISLITFCSFIFAALLGLSLSTGFLARDLIQCRNSSWRWYPQTPRQRTRLPLNSAYQSSNNYLDFVQVYPPLEASPSSACAAAWNTLRSVPCHEKIWNRSWDNGKHSSIFDPDIGLYSQQICNDRCTAAVTRALYLISAQCTEEDTFDLSYYSGPMLADPGLESGPLAVIETIAARVTHTCREEPSTEWRHRYYRNSLSYCVAVMWEDWFIVDGMNAGNLEGLAAFDRRTSKRHTEFGRYRSHMVTDSCDAADSYSSRYVSTQTFGPGDNETTCGFCALNWLERKVLAWEEGKIKDPETGEAVGLKEYLKRVRKMGRRCESDGWERVWNRALKKYKGGKPCRDGEEGSKGGWEWDGEVIDVEGDGDGVKEVVVTEIEDDVPFTSLELA